MENNTPTPPSATPTPVSTEQQTSMQSAPPLEHKSRFGLLLVILALLGLFFLGGTYVFVTMQKTASSPIPITNKNVQTQTTLHELEEQTQNLENTDIDDGFTEVDHELKNL
jgi:uncharacterized protein HemX